MNDMVKKSMAMRTGMRILKMKKIFF